MEWYWWLLILAGLFCVTVAMSCCIVGGRDDERAGRDDR